MRKLIIEEWLSLEGYAAESNGSTDFFGSRKWGNEVDEEMIEFMKTTDTIVLGANTYRIFVEFWPASDPNEEIMTEPINETRKIVFSNSLESAEWGKFEPAEIISGDAIEQMRKLKSEPGKNMILWGSLSLARTFLDAGLVDEIHLRTCPIILGNGLKFFEESGEIELELKDVTKYDSGLVLTEYLVKN
ncbi:MAG: reductase [Flavobacterium sp.]|uniref:dihydrofolate reductase family protein n=1 Tax=Flavobacterium sp. TaxID=239 RepID=UPI0012184B39|nr:dihydrofolate reductase family protein [Flavobacterium sp.]RZJ68207.1 MAG: reductase [Flavobacterium sp.]